MSGVHAHTDFRCGGVDRAPAWSVTEQQSTVRYEVRKKKGLFAFTRIEQKW